MTSDLLNFIITAADCSSISKAALNCGISQPALSQSIKKVEKELGISIFIRHTHGVELTRCGSVFINNSRAMLYVESQMLEAIKQLK